jgi:hypothetical protein
MKLIAFRVQNYKRIQDTDWVDCEDLMVFVGKNESGKTALLRGLSKLNPTDGEKYDGLREFPHGRYTDEFKKQDWPVASARFQLDDEDREELATIWPVLRDAQIAEVTRHYSDTLTVLFDPSPPIPQVSIKDWQEFCGQTATAIEEAIAPDGQGEAWKPKKELLTQWFRTQERQAETKDVDLQSAAEDARSQLTGQMTEQWSKDLLSRFLPGLSEIIDKLSAKLAVAKAEKWVADNMPHFLYFGEYEVLDSAIYLPEFVQRVSSDDHSPKTRVQRALFKHVGADIAELAKLGHHEHSKGHDAEIQKQIDKLTILADSAQQAMTKKFSDWWEQRRHTFNY